MILCLLAKGNKEGVEVKHLPELGTTTHLVLVAPKEDIHEEQAWEVGHRILSEASAVGTSFERSFSEMRR